MPDRERDRSSLAPLSSLPKLLVLGACAWFAASTVNALARLAIAPMPAAPQLAPARPALSPEVDAAPPAVRPRPAADRPGVEVERLALRRAEIEAIVDPGDIAAPARIVPLLGPGGALRGFRIASIQPGCAYELLGMRDGDVLTRIDGEQLTLDGGGFGFVDRLYSHTLSSVELVRGPRTIRKELEYVP